MYGMYRKSRIAFTTPPAGGLAFIRLNKRTTHFAHHDKPTVGHVTDG